MRFSLLKNDKSTFVDEVILGVIVMISVIIGGFLIKLHPTFWIIDENDVIVFGTIIVIFGFMFIPALVYRLWTNDNAKTDK